MKTQIQPLAFFTCPTNETKTFQLVSIRGGGGWIMGVKVLKPRLNL